MKCECVYEKERERENENVRVCVCLSVYTVEHLCVFKHLEFMHALLNGLHTLTAYVYIKSIPLNMIVLHTTNSPKQTLFHFDNLHLLVKRFVLTAKKETVLSTT